MPPYRIRALTAEPNISENQKVSFELGMNIVWKGDSWPQYDEAAQAIAAEEQLNEGLPHGTTYTVEEVESRWVIVRTVQNRRTGLLNAEWVPRMHQVEKALSSRYNYWRLGVLARLHTK